MTTSSRLADGEGVQPVIEEIASTGQIAFDLVESFLADKVPDIENFRSLFHYYGILSMVGRERGQTVFKVPNLYAEYQLHQIVYQFKGAELVCAKQIAEEQM